MIEEFRDFLIQANIKREQDESLNSNPLYQFQVLMKSLRDVNRTFHDPSQFCANFKNFDGSPVNVMVQMDADEFFNNLLDKLEKQLKAAGSGDAISRTFGGETVQEIICKDHDFKSERVNPFMALPVEVKGNMNLQQCLD